MPRLGWARATGDFVPESPTGTETKTDLAVIVAAKEAEEEEDETAEANEGAMTSADRLRCDGLGGAPSDSRSEWL